MEADVSMNESKLEDEEEFLTSLENTLSTVENNLSKFIKDTPQIFAVPELNDGLRDLEIKEEKMEDVLRLFPKSVAKFQKENTEKLSALELKCEELRIQLLNKTRELETAQAEMQQQKNQMLNQSAFCASLGAVLGNLTWRASRFPEIVDIWLSGNKMGEFLSIVNGSFVAFVNTYGSTCPPTDNAEYQFIIGLLGIVTNISASPEGRQFLITDPNGKDLVQKIIKLMPSLRVSSGSNFLKRLMLMILFNVSMNKTGLLHLFDSQIGDLLSHCLETSSSEKMQLLCLRVLQSIAYDLTEPKYVQSLLTSIPIERIESVAASEQSGISDVAKQVIKHLRDSQKFMESN